MGAAVPNKTHYFLGLAVLLAVLGFGVGKGIEVFAPEHAFKWYPVIPVFFYVLGVVYFYMFEFCYRQAPRKTLFVFMGLKLVKLIVFVLAILLYVLFADVQKKEFVLTFSFFYLCTLLYESIYFYFFECGLRRKKE